MTKRVSIVFVLALGLVLSIAALSAADKSKVYYVCNCKDECACGTISREPGKCTCGTELAAMHILAIEGNQGIFCRCGAGCSCERSKDDPDKCGCGKPVKKISLKGKYVCACGGDCTCYTISNEPGKCTCGTELKKVE